MKGKNNENNINNFSDIFFNKYSISINNVCISKKQPNTIIICNFRYRQYYILDFKRSNWYCQTSI